MHGEGVSKAKTFEGKYQEAKLEFMEGCVCVGGGGGQTIRPSVGWGYGYCLEPHISYFVCLCLQVGDLIETYLVQIRDLDKVMKSAKTGSVKERRNAAFELASLAATGDDTKFRIVQEGGYVK